MYTIINKSSRKGHKHQNKNSLLINELPLNFYNKLSSSDQLKLIGGDGTVNWIINRLKLGKLIVTNNGTGNDLYRSLTAEFQQVNISHANDQMFANGFGVGFDGLVCKKVNNKLRKNKASYISAVILSLHQFKPFTANVEIDGINHRFERVYLLACQNGKYLGSGMKIAPTAQVTNEELSVIIIHNISKGLLLTIFPTVFLGVHSIFTKYVTCLTGKKITIKTSTSQYSQTDGETSNPKTHFEVQSNIRKILMKRVK